MLVYCVQCLQTRPSVTPDLRCTNCGSEFIDAVEGELPAYRPIVQNRGRRPRPQLMVTQDGEIITLPHDVLHPPIRHRRRRGEPLNSFHLTPGDRDVVMRSAVSIRQDNYTWVKDCHFATIRSNWMMEVRFALPKEGRECMICLSDMEKGTEAFFCKNHPMCLNCLERATETHFLMKRACSVCGVNQW